MAKINATDELLDEITKHSIELQRLANNTTDGWIRKEYTKLSRELGALTRSNHFFGGSIKSQKKRVELIIKRGSESIALMHNDLYNSMQDTLREVGEVETHFSQNSVNKAATGKGTIIIAANSLSPRKISKTASDIVTQGTTQKEVWKRHSRKVREGFTDIIKHAYRSGEAMETTVGNITGTRERNYKNGLMRVSANQANTLARTSILNMSNTIRQETYLENKDVIRGVEFLAHLDSRTTTICMAHAGDKWLYMSDGSMKSIAGGHDYAQPPLHFNCRSTIVPIVRSASDLSPEKQKLIPSSRRESLGAPPSKSKYRDADAWLKTQPVAYQKDVLGKAHNLWSAGKVSFQRFVSQKGRLRTPEDLATLYSRKELVPESVLRLRTTETFKPYAGASKEFVDELSKMEKGKFLQIEERLMTGKTVSSTQSDLIGRVIRNADPLDLELAKSFDPVDFKDFVGSKGKRLAFYNHTSKRFSRFAKLSKGDLSKRSTAKLNEIDDLVKKELIEKITSDGSISQANKNILIDMFEESSRIVGTQRSLPMVESLLTLSRKADFKDIKGDFLGYLQRSSENAVNSYFSRVKRLEMRLGQGIEKERRYAILSSAAKDRHLSATKAKGNSLKEASSTRKKISKIGDRKLRDFVGDEATELTVNLEMTSGSTITNFLAHISESRMTSKQIKDWSKRLSNKKQQIVISRTAPSEQVLLSDKFLNLKEFKTWQDNLWSGRGFPPKIRDEVGEVLGDVQIYQDLKYYLRGKVITPKAIAEAGMTADQYIDDVLRKFLEESGRLDLEYYKLSASKKISNLYKLDGKSRKKLRAIRERRADKEQSEGFFARVFRAEEKKTARDIKIAKDKAAKEAKEQDDWVFIDKTNMNIGKAIDRHSLNPKREFFKETSGSMRGYSDEDLEKISRLVNQEAFGAINTGGSYLSAAKKLGEKYYLKFEGIEEIAEDEAIRMGNFLLIQLEKSGAVSRFKSVSLVREFDWEPPKEQTMWMLKSKDPKWEKAILSNKKNYQFDGLPNLTPQRYVNGILEDLDIADRAIDVKTGRTKLLKEGIDPKTKEKISLGRTAIRGTTREEVKELLSKSSSRPAIKNLDYEGATGIKVNGYVYDIQTEMERRGAGIGTAIPAKATSKLDIAARSTRDSWDRVRKVAGSLRDDVFYNNMSNDKYARTYANTITLHWQGDHVNKGLMLFSKGVKMGKHGEDAFKQEFINVALNGFDKLPIKVRRKVYDLIPDKMILDTIKDPIKHDWWYAKTDWFKAGLLKDDLRGIPKEWAAEVRKLAVAGESDGAWNFLSLLKERQEMIAWTKRGKKIENFVSYKQLQVDGTTNVLNVLALSREISSKKLCEFRGSLEQIILSQA